MLFFYKIVPKFVIPYTVNIATCGIQAFLNNNILHTNISREN